MRATLSLRLIYNTIKQISCVYGSRLPTTFRIQYSFRRWKNIQIILFVKLEGNTIERNYPTNGKLKIILDRILTGIDVPGFRLPAGRGRNRATRAGLHTEFPADRHGNCQPKINRLITSDLERKRRLRSRKNKQKGGGGKIRSRIYDRNYFHFSTESAKMDLLNFAWVLLIYKT